MPPARLSVRRQAPCSSSLPLLFPALRGAGPAADCPVCSTGCAGLPPRTPEPPTTGHCGLSRHRARPGGHPTEFTPPDGLNSLRPLIEASYALDARLELMRRAQSSLDVQTYQLGNDKTGRLLLRELRDAARRGVRVRLLLDDFYTAGMDAPAAGPGCGTQCRSAGSSILL
jgi:putative cardiolipin synthase